MLQDYYFVNFKNSIQVKLSWRSTSFIGRFNARKYCHHA